MRKIAALIVLLAVPTDLWALKTPSGDEIKAIQKLVDEANKPSRVFGRMAEIEEKIGLRPKGGGDRLSPPEVVRPKLGRGDSWYVDYKKDVETYNKKHEAAIRRLTALSGDEREEYAAVLRQYYADQKRSAGLYEKAFEATMTAYGIPVPKSGQVVNGAPRPRSAAYLSSHVGSEASWKPTYDPKLKEGKYGDTDSRGRVTIGPGAFKYPGWLALTLYHESLHYQELLGAKRSDFWNEAEREVRVRERCEPELKRFFDVNDEDYERHQKKTAEKRWDSKVWIEQKRAGFDPFYIEHREAFPEAGTIDPFEEGGAIPMPETVEIARRARELDRGIQEFARKRHLASLRSLAERLCSDPESVTQADFDGLVYVTDPDFYWREQDRVVKSGEFFGTCWGGRYGNMLLDLRHSSRLLAQSYKPPKASEPPPVVFAPPQPPQITMPPPTLSPIEDIILVDLALKACSEGVTADDLKKFAWFPRPEVEIGGYGYGGGRLGKGCALKVYKYFVELNTAGGKLDADAINRQAGGGGFGGDEGDRPRGSPRREWSTPPNPKLTPPKFR